MSNTFAEVFGGYITKEASRELLACGEIQKIKYREKNKSMEIQTAFPCFVAHSVLCEAEEDIRKGLGAAVQIAPSFPGEALCPEVLDSVVFYLKRKNAAVNGTFEGAAMAVEGEMVTITLTHGGLNILESTGCDKALASLIYEQYGKRVKVAFAGVTETDEVIPAPPRAEERVPFPMDTDVPPEKEPSFAAPSNMPVPAERQAPKRRAPVRRIPGNLPRNLPILMETAQVVYGKPINDPPISLKDLPPEPGEYTVWGEIFDFESRDTKSGKARITSFNITDLTSSTSVKIVQFTGRVKNLQEFEDLKNGVCVLLKGQYTYDTYVHEYTFDAKHISIVKRRKKEDKAEKKRVELHMHTNMSAMDGMTPAEKLIKFAASLGHKAVAVTDHGVAQAFPEAMNAAAAVGNDFKVLYGVEAYYVNDEVPAVSGSADTPFDGEFIVFDLETTGLNAQNERITEIGAVKMVKGEKKAEFNTFVNPQIPIPPKITELTGITNDMVKDAPLEEEALKQFLDFCGDAPLVAHNAPFDTSFVKAAAKRCKLSFANTSIDTVPICRKLLPNIKNHKLNTVADHLKLGKFNHHRACDDAAMLAPSFRSFF